MKNFVFNLPQLLILVAFFIFYLFVMPANAHVFSPIECASIAHDAGYIATLRDNGAQELDVIKQLGEDIESIKGVQESYIHDDSDLETIIRIIHFVYKYPNIIPRAINALTYQGCSGTVSSPSPKPQKPQLSI